MLSGIFASFQIEIFRETEVADVHHTADCDDNGCQNVADDRFQERDDAVDENAVAKLPDCHFCSDPPRQPQDIDCHPHRCCEDQNDRENREEGIIGFDGVQARGSGIGDDGEAFQPQPPVLLRFGRFFRNLFRLDELRYRDAEELCQLHQIFRRGLRLPGLPFGYRLPAHAQLVGNVLLG